VHPKFHQPEGDTAFTALDLGDFSSDSVPKGARKLKPPSVFATSLTAEIFFVCVYNDASFNQLFEVCTPLLYVTTAL
jgi:hypothetical protein